MVQESDDFIWQQLAKRLFGVQKTADERLFTARVMADVRNLQPADSTWFRFARWALPTLALSMSGFAMAVVYSLRPDTVSAETLLLDGEEPGVSEEWLASYPADEQIQDPLVKS